jgi:hypothetical protein
MKTNLLMLAIAAALAAGNAMAEEKKAEKKSDYPLTTCVVSDEKLGSMGKPYVLMHDGKEVQLCCKSCEKDFKKSPDKYLKKLEAAKSKSK